jgi:FAD/FMN-containing dehydrogenase
MDFIKDLTSIVGADNVTASPVDCLAYSRDMSIHAGVPQAVVFASDTEQVSKILALANSQRSPSWPGTNIDHRGRAGDEVVWCGFREHSPGGQRATVMQWLNRGHL